MRVRVLFANLALALVSLALVLVGLELGARALVRHWEAQPGAVRDPVVRYHPTLGWDKPPGVDAWIHRPEYNVHLVINSHGLRGPESGYEKPAGVHRTLLLGDSFAEGYTVSEERTVRARLEGLLRAGGCPGEEVLNGGTAAYSTDQEYIFYREEGQRYAPDVVVVLFFYNDLAGDTPGDLRKPYFDVADGHLVLRNSPVPPPREGRGAVRPFHVKDWRGSIALRLLSDRTSGANPRLHRFLARWGLVEPESDDPLPDEFLPFVPGHKEQVARMWAGERLILDSLRQEVAAHGGRLVLFYVPARFEVNDEAWDLTREKYVSWMPRKAWRRERVFDTLAETCRTLGVPLLDPRAALRGAEEAGRRAYFVRDGHWNEEGHAVAAQELAHFLGANGFSCGRSAPR